MKNITSAGANAATKTPGTASNGTVNVLSERSQIVYAPHAKCHVSEQIRKHFGEEEMEGLAANIYEIGIQFPILCRPSKKEPGLNEIIAGERRWRGNGRALEKALGLGDAAKIKLLTDIPLIIKNLSDREALEIQLIENLQRENVTAREEADGFAKMLELKDDAGGLVYPTLAAIGARIGKSINHIKDRMKLRVVPESAWKAFEEKKLTISHLELIGGVAHPKDRTEVTKVIVDGNRVWNGEEHVQVPLSVKDSARFISTNLQVSLKGCGWSLDDATLVQEEHKGNERICGGACTGCPHRSADSEALKGQIQAGRQGTGKGTTRGIDPNFCFNRTCYDMKAAAVWRKTKEAAENEGRRVWDVDAASKEFYAYSETALEAESKFVDLSSSPGYNELGHHTNEKTPDWETLLKDTDARKLAVLARHPKTKKVHLLLEREKAIELATGNGHAKLFKARPVPTKTTNTREDAAARKKDQQKYELQHKQHRMEGRLTLEAIADKLRKVSDVKKPIGAVLVEMAANLAAYDDPHDWVLRYCGEPIDEKVSLEPDEIVKLVLKKYEKEAAGDSEAWVRWVVVLLAIAEDEVCGNSTRFNKDLIEVLKIDRKKITEQAKGAVSAAEKRALEAELQDVREKKLVKNLNGAALKVLQAREIELCKELGIKVPEQLHTCEKCQQNNLTAAGLKSHNCAKRQAANAKAAKPSVKKIKPMMPAKKSTAKK